jgi:DNA-binding Lrp family transcriptional regulator
MASRVRVSENELLEELAKYAAGDAPEDAMTKQELAVAAGVSPQTVINRLRVLQRQGRVRVHRVVREKLDGHSQPVPAYTILPAKGKR